MACAAIQTGSHFLGSTLAHLDCQGQSIGAYGYGALSDPGSIVAGSMTALLTIFIALFGIRLLLGHPMGLRDVMGDIIRVGLVLTLALSWPAWRVIGYDVVLKGPGEIAAIVGGASGLPGSSDGMVARLQNIDDGIVAITMYGSGRLTGGVVGGSDRGDSFHGIAMADETGFGWGRVFFLISALGPFGILHVGGGILLALAPVMAGLMLFGQTMGLFVGWVRGLVFAALGSLALTLCQGVEISVLSPWANDILDLRSSNTFTPSAPTELLALTMGFCVLNFGMLALVGRVSFMPFSTLMQWMIPATQARSTQLAAAGGASLSSPAHPTPHETHSRAAVIAEAVAGTMRREDGGGFPASPDRRGWTGADVAGGGNNATGRAGQTTGSGEMLGNSFRRAQRRTSTAGQKRDRQA